MKRNVNVFIAVVLVAVLCGGIVWLRTANDEKLGWNIHDTYGEAPAYSNNGAAYTNATFAGPSNDGGVMTLSPSRTMRHSAAPSYAGAYTISYGVSSAPLTSLPLSSPSLQGGDGGRLGGQGLYTTSSKTFNSYGGGGNGGAAMGGAMSNGRSNSGLSNPSLQGGAGVGSISPIAYSTARRSDMTVAAGENLAQMVAENPVVAMTNAANAGMSNGFYGGYTAMDYSGSANYGQYTGMFGGSGRMGVRGRQNADGFGDAWWVWFNTWATTNGGSYTDGKGNYYFDEGTLREVYNDFINSYWNSGMGEEPEFADWLEWYMEYTNTENGYYGYDDNKYYWGSLTPVGDILPLLLIALLYMLFVAIKSKSLKSLWKTERSE